MIMHNKHKVFISYHHENDQQYKEYLVAMATRHGLFIDHSVDTGDISDSLDDQRIREIIRDDYLQDSTVTIVLVGKDTARRKHVDWEIYSSMYDGKRNKKSGVLVITLPTIRNDRLCTRHGGNEKKLYPDALWKPIGGRRDYEQACPSMPDRIIDNLVAREALVSVTGWSDIERSPDRLRSLIELAFRDRAKCKYDLKRRMRRRNS